MDGHGSMEMDGNGWVVGGWMDMDGKDMDGWMDGTHGWNAS